MRRDASHLLALLAGLAVAASLHPQAAEKTPAAEEQTRLRGTTGPQNGKAEAFSMAWRSLAARDLSVSERRAAKRELLEQWAKEEPLHFLRFFENRATPEGWDDAVVEALRTDQPEELIRFARDHGGLRLLGALAEEMDPRRAIRVLGEEEGIPPELFKEVAKRGAAVDPEFASRVNELPEGLARDFFLRGVMEVQIELEHHQAAAETLARLQQNGPEMATELGEWLAHDGIPWSERAGVILSLPEKHRHAAYEGAMDWGAGEIESHTTEPAEIRDFLSSLVEGGIPAVVPVPDEIDLPVEEAEIWGSWALDLPEGGAWEELRRSGLVLWLTNDDSAADRLWELPPGAARDTAMQALVQDLREDGDEEGASRALTLMSAAARAEWERKDALSPP